MRKRGTLPAALVTDRVVDRVAMIPDHMPLAAVVGESGAVIGVQRSVGRRIGIDGLWRRPCRGHGGVRRVVGVEQVGVSAQARRPERVRRRPDDAPVALAARGQLGSSVVAAIRGSDRIAAITANFYSLSASARAAWMVLKGRRSESGASWRGTAP